MKPCGEQPLPTREDVEQAVDRLTGTPPLETSMGRPAEQLHQAADMSVASSGEADGGDRG